MEYYVQDEIDILKFLLFQSDTLAEDGIVHFTEVELAAVCPLDRANKILMKLENESLIDVSGVMYDPGAKKPGDSIYGIEVSLIERRLERLLSKLTAVDASILPLEDWRLVENSTEDTAEIKFMDEIRYSFKALNTNKYRYFKCIWEAGGNTATNKEVYEYSSTEKYPDNYATNTNERIRDTIRRLTKEPAFSKLPFTIISRRGFRLEMK